MRWGIEIVPEEPRGAARRRGDGVGGVAAVVVSRQLLGGSVQSHQRCAEGKELQGRVQQRSPPRHCELAAPVPRLQRGPGGHVRSSVRAKREDARVRTL